MPVAFPLNCRRFSFPLFSFLCCCCCCCNSSCVSTWPNIRSCVTTPLQAKTSTHLHIYNSWLIPILLPPYSYPRSNAKGESIRSACNMVLLVALAYGLHKREIRVLSSIDINIWVEKAHEEVRPTTTLTRARLKHGEIRIVIYAYLLHILVVKASDLSNRSIRSRA